MNTSIQKWGNSLGVRLPKHVLRDSALQEGSEVSVEVDKERVVITAVPEEEKEVSLKKLLRGITPQNTHKETDWGERTGKEAW